jgi:hypothetical protein
MRTNWDVLSARTLGALALPDACERCFWLHQRIGAPDSPFPGIFSSIDSYSKKVLQAALQHAKRLPHWFERFGLHGEPLPSPHHSWFKIATGHGSLQLSGTPDEILLAPDGGLIIIDYKTARFKPEDSLRPLYEVQLNVYARIAENFTPPRNGYPFPCRVQTLGLMYYDPLTDRAHGKPAARVPSCPSCYSPSSSQIASIFAFTSGDIRITSGHSRVKPSSFHLVVASKPILLP